MNTKYDRLIADLKSVGVKTDATVEEAIALIGVVRAAKNTAPVADLVAAYASGEITTENAAQAIIDTATLAVASERITIAADAIEDAASGTLRRWLATREDQIVKAMRPAFDAAAAQVQVAGTHFPPGVSDAHLIALGSKAVIAREGLDEALDVVSKIRGLRVDVADCAGFAGQDVTWYIEGARDLDHLDAAHRAYTGTGNAFHALAAQGFTLRLNTRAEAAKVAAGARTVSETQEAERRAKRAAEIRDGWPQFTVGTGGIPKDHVA